MIQQQPSFKMTTALWQIVGGFMIVWLPGVLSSLIQSRLGLEGLEMAGWLSLGLSVISIGGLLAFSADARLLCRAVPCAFGTKVTGYWILGLIVGNGLLAGLIFISYKMLFIPPAVLFEPGWAHYFSLPANGRPEFLLHYLCVRAVDMIVTGPIAEELFHIGIVIGVLRRGGFPWPWIFAFDAVLFVVLHYAHGGQPAGIVPLLTYATARLFLDFLFYKTGNIAVPVVAHSLINLRVVSYNWFPLLP